MSIQLLRPLYSYNYVELTAATKCGCGIDMELKVVQPNMSRYVFP